MTYNSLIIRFLFTRPHVSPNNIGLHKGWTHIRPATSGFASCGRAFCMLLLGFMLFVGAGCTNESLQSTGEMERLYAESTTLPTVAADSIQRFAYKLETYAQKNPQAQADPLWPEIIENIKSAAHGASIHFVITINPDWNGEIEFYF